MADEKIVPPMHDAYYKARKLFVSFGLLLLINEWAGIVGITITDVIEKVSFWGVEINVERLKIGPNALVGVVVVYFLFWAYFGVRFFIEWHQVDRARRKVDASRWDFRLTFFIAIVALILWGVKRISGIQVPKEPLEFLLPFFVGLIVPLIFNFRKRSTLDEVDEKRKKRYYITFVILSITAPVLTFAFLLFINNISFITIISLISGFIIGLWKNALDGMPPFSPTNTTGSPSDPSISPVTTETTDRNNKSEARSTKSETNSKSKEPKQRKEPGRETYHRDARPKVFICHANEDKSFAASLYEKLKAAGLEPWLDKENLRGGDRWDEKIKLAINREIDYFLVLQSKALEKKVEGYVNKEIYEALERQKTFRFGIRFIIPLKFEDCRLLEELDRLQTIDLDTEEKTDDLIRIIKQDYAKRGRR